MTEGAAFHFDEATGLVARCNLSVDCSQKLHFDQRQEALQAAEELKEQRLKKGFEQLQEASLDFQDTLKEATAGGFVVASEAYPQSMGAQLRLMKTQEGFRQLCHSLVVSSNSRHRVGLAKAIAWVLREEAELMRELPQKTFHRMALPHLPASRARTQVLEALSMGKPATQALLKTAASTWLYSNSKYHEAARSLLFGEEQQLRGYEEREEFSLQEFPTASVLERFNVTLDQLPEGYLAYDIETDTTEGYGLRPYRGCITEIVASTRETSWVISGEEVALLNAFAEILSAQAPGTITMGWNNYGFDTIALQTRAELHDLPSWRGELLEAPNHTRYQSVGPTGTSYALSWVTPQGVRLRDRDVFQEKVLLDVQEGVGVTRGLKPFVKTLGCTPVVVDRTRLHELSPQERQAYVLSDGVITLRAAHEVDRRAHERGISLESLSPGGDA